MNPEYIKLQFKELDRDLRKYHKTKSEKLEALDYFRDSFLQKIHDNYPQRFPECPPITTPSRVELHRMYHISAETAQDLDSLSVAGGREIVLAEIEKRKKKIESGWSARIEEVLGTFYKLCEKGMRN